MTRFAVRGAFLAIKGVACLAGGLLFAVLPLLIVACLKGAKWSLKATLWTIGAVIVLMFGRSA